LIGSHQPQEEEVFTLQTSYQGQGQGQGSEVETLNIACCFGGTLLAQIKHSRKSNIWNTSILCRLFKNKAPCLAFNISQPVHWKWKKKNAGLSSIMLELKLSTLQGFCAVDHDFLHLPQLLKTFCNHDYHVRQIKLALD
jgi:hypothetical protein